MKNSFKSLKDFKILSKKDQEKIKSGNSGISYYYRECAYYINGPLFCRLRGKSLYAHYHGSSFGCWTGGRDQEIACIS